MVPKTNFPQSLPPDIAPYMVAESELRRDYDVPEDQSVGGQSADVRIESTDYF